MRDVTQGAERVRRWPRKRGRPKTPEEKARRDAFRVVQLATKFMAPRMVSDFTSACRGTPLMPRDLLTSMMYNRLAMFVLDDGRKLWPEVAMRDVDELLDIITQTDGEGIRRTAEGWRGVPFPTVPTIDELLAELGGVDGQVLRKVGGLWVPADLPAAPTQLGPARYYNSVDRLNVTGDGTAYQVPLNTNLITKPFATLNTGTGAVTINQAGDYIVNAVAVLKGGDTHDWSYLEIKRNGNSWWTAGRDFTDEAVSRLDTSTVITCAVGDVLTLVVIAGGGAKTMDLNSGGTETSMIVTKLN